MGFFKDRVAPIILSHEGGYVNNPRDPGGETNWGITVKVARKYGYKGPMRDMNRDDALEIYERIYFVEPGFSKVATFAPNLAVKLVDVGVNCGTNTAAIMLQKSLNALNRRGRDYADIKEDGDIGPASIKALNGYLAVRRGDGELVLISAVRFLQGARYIEISRKNDDLEDFVFGWLKRAAL